MWFNKKKKENLLLEYMVEYVSAARKTGLSDIEIRQRLVDQNRPANLISLALEINDLKGGKMAKKDEDYEDDDERGLDDDLEEEEVRKPVKPVERPRPVEKKEEGMTKQQIEAALVDHENRIRNIEATLYRIKGLI